MKKLNVRVERVMFKRKLQEKLPRHHFYRFKKLMHGRTIAGNYQVSHFVLQK